MMARESGQKFPDLVYGFLLMLYPPGFRLRFGSELVQVFRDTHRGKARQEGFGKRLAFWLWTLRDLAHSLPGEWGQALMHDEGINALMQMLSEALTLPAMIIAMLVMWGYTCALLAQFLENMTVPGAQSSMGLSAVGACAALILGIASAFATWAIGRTNKIKGPIFNL